MSSIHPNRKRVFLAAALIAPLALAYGDTFTAPFIFDDTINILENASIRHLWPPWKPFDIPADTGLAGRPIVNFTLAVNYALSGKSVWSYHAANLVIHMLATLMLFAVIMLVPASPGAALRGKVRVLFAFACSLLWGLHPVQTQAVTYVIQRCESLMALGVLATYFCALRGWQADSPRGWHLAALLSFLLAMFTKEVAAVTPLLLLGHEWVFMGRSPLKTLGRSKLLYGGMALAILLAVLGTLLDDTLALRTQRNPFSPVDYWVTQFPVILHYLRLLIWPSGLTLDYGWPMAKMQEAWPAAALVLTLLLASLWALWRRRAAGFLGACFFLFLAPSSLVPLPDPAFEHRLYLPSAAFVILIVGAAFLILTKGRDARTGDDGSTGGRALALPMALLLGLALILGWTTHERNRDYRSDMAIWSDVIQKRPGNFRGYHGVALALSRQNKPQEALAYLKRAIGLNPGNAYLYNDAGYILFTTNRAAEAVFYFQESIRIKPFNPKAHNNLGAALAQTGRREEALGHFSAALAMKPDYAEARSNLMKASQVPAGKP